jgi:proteasome accessory factor A
LLAQDRAGERILEGLSIEAEERLVQEGIHGDVYLFKNNTDSAGNSYGCHENFLIERKTDFASLAQAFIPFLISRQILVGAGKVVQTPRGSTYAVSQRADHIWEGVSSATTRSRPIINTRDEPHADADLYRRLHVIVGDSNMSDTTNLLKVVSAHLVLSMIESGTVMRDLTLANPIRAIREISHDTTGTRTVKLANGRELSAIEMQSEYFGKVTDFVARRGIVDPVTQRVMELWERSIKAVGAGDLHLIDREIDWVIKLRLIERYMRKNDMTLENARIAQLDLAYHDIRRERGLFYLLERGGAVDSILTPEQVELAKNIAPQTTRAKLRGDFITRAQERRRDYTVDWVHLKLNDQGQRTVLLKDPFQHADERVDRLIASM